MCVLNLLRNKSPKATIFEIFYFEILFRQKLLTLPLQLVLAGVFIEDGMRLKNNEAEKYGNK